MAYVKSANVTVSYDASDKTTSFNNLVYALAEKLAELGEVSHLETINLSSGFPLYQGITNTSTPSLNIFSSTQDIYSNFEILGTDKNNYCVGLGVSALRQSPSTYFLHFSLAISSDKNQEIKNDIPTSTQSLYKDRNDSILSYLCRKNYNKDDQRCFTYDLPIVISNNQISITINYISSENGTFFKFILSNSYSDYYNLGFFKNDNGMSAFISSKSVNYGTTTGNAFNGCLIPLSERVQQTGAEFGQQTNAQIVNFITTPTTQNLSLFKPYIICASGQHGDAVDGGLSNLTDSYSYGIFSTINWAIAFCNQSGIGQESYGLLATTYSSSSSSSSSYSDSYSSSSSSSSSYSDSSSYSSINMALSSFNMPLLTGADQIFLRRQYQPLTNYRTSLYVGLFPSIETPTSGSIFELSNGKKYMLITPSILGLFMELDS